MEKSCDCQCHVRGVIGFFHCFSFCCAETYTVIYESEAERAAAHAPRTRLEIAQHIANEYRHWNKTVREVELFDPLSARIIFDDGTDFTVNGKFATDLNRAPTQ